VFKCGGTLTTSEDGEVHSLVISMKKWFGGSRMWLLSVNEDIEVYEDADRYDAELHQIDQIREVQLTIFSKNFEFFLRRKRTCCQTYTVPWIQDPRSSIFHDPDQGQKWRFDSTSVKASKQKTTKINPTPTQ